MKPDLYKGHILALCANIIFGLNTPMCKILLSGWFSPVGLVTVRLIFSMVAFWCIGLFFTREKVILKDKLVIAIGSLFGLIIPQLTLAQGLHYTSPVNFSMIVAMTPIIVMLLAAAILREGISFGKLIGVGFGVAGALLVILQAQTHGVGRDDLQGIFYAVLNTISFGLYMIITRKVTQKYSAMTLLLWTYFFGVIMFVPFTFTTLPEQVMFQGNTPWHIWGALVFVLVFATTLAYFLLPLALRYIHTTTVSLYMNLQPIVASVVAILLGQDILTWDKPVAVLLVITGVYIVTRAERRG